MKKKHISHTLYKTSLNEGRRGGVKAVTGTVEYILVT